MEEVLPSSAETWTLEKTRFPSNTQNVTNCRNFMTHDGSPDPRLTSLCGTTAPLSIPNWPRALIWMFLKAGVGHAKSVISAAMKSFVPLLLAAWIGLIQGNDVAASPPSVQVFFWPKGGCTEANPDLAIRLAPDSPDPLSLGCADPAPCPCDLAMSERLEALLKGIGVGAG